jgi:NAD(P)-dependent dehydrogenase (short-subunit alcohol dehydrogenase family)
VFDLSGQCALVTGASSGLGLHFARTLAAAGAAVALAARRRAKLDEAVTELRAQGRSATSIEIDVTDRDSVRRCFRQARAELGKVPTVVVSSAGVTETRSALDYSGEQWDRIVDTNLKGAWMVAQEAARCLIDAGSGGSIINITSILATRVAGGLTPYLASKAGLKHLTCALALELARHRIRVNSLAPGYFATDLNQDFLATDAGQKVLGRIPARRFGVPEDLDGALLLLASDAGRYITGTEIVVDGGHLCSSL